MAVPDRPIIPFIEGDGTGPDIWRASQRVFDAAVAKAYGGKRRDRLDGDLRRREGARALRQGRVAARGDHRGHPRFKIAHQGPAHDAGRRRHPQLNVTLRQVLDLYACVRPVRYFKGVPSPVKEPQKVDMVIFRENTEDVYSGIEFKAGSARGEEAHRVHPNASEEGDPSRTSGIGIKPMSAFGSKRLVRLAIDYAIAHGSRA